MNLKKILTTILFLNITVFFAQKNNLCGEINYKQIKNISKIYEQNFIMKFSNKQSLYEEINIKKSNNKIDEKSSKKGMTETVSIGRTNTISHFFFNNKSGFYFRDIFFNEVLLVKEDEFKWNWSLQQDTKKIGNFICQKATIKFRGRNYIAWFTNEIPVKFGPWKFQGLSGLILEVYDEDKVFHIIANRVKLGKNNCSFDINTKELENAMTLNSYLDKKEELIDKMFAKMSSKRPKGTKPFKRDKNCKDCSNEIEIFNEKN